MPLNAAALDIAGEAIAAAAVRARLFTTTPNATGTNPISGATYQTIDLDSTDGNITLAAPVTFTGATSGVSIGFVGFFTAAEVFLGYVPRTTGDAAVNASGQYILQSVSIPASAS